MNCRDLTAALTLAALVSVPARAQTPPPPSEPPTQAPTQTPTQTPTETKVIDDGPGKSPSTLDRAEEDLRARRPAPKPGQVAPETIQAPEPIAQGPVALPGMMGAEGETPAISRRPEGFVISRQTGRLARTASGTLLFLLDPPNGAAARRLQGLIVLPSGVTDRLEKSPNVGAIPTLALDAQGRATAGGDGPRVTLSGPLYVYRGRQFLLPSAFSTTVPTAAPESAPAPTSAPNTKPETKPEPNPAPSAPAAQPTNADVPPGDDVASIIRDLETKRLMPRGLDRPAPEAGAPSDAPSPSASAPEAPSGAPGATGDEGLLVTARRGRLVRLKTGELTVTFDNGTGSAGRMPPLVVLPCRLLESMEDLVARRGDELAVTVSGRVVSGRGRAFLMPSAVTVRPELGVRPTP